LASVAGHLSGNKRPASGSKKGPKKAKAKQRTQDQSQTADESGAATTSSIQDTTGFASLGEAVARLEAASRSSEDNKADISNEPMPMDVEENDDVDRVPAQPAHSPQESEPMNGSHRVPNGIKEGAEPDIPGHHRKEGGPSKGPDALIDKEDELTNASPDEVLELKMHSSEVFMCAWNPIFTDTVATGSGDASARIWQMGGTKASDGLGPVCLLPHGTGPKDKKNKDVTTLEWSSDGNLLATGSYDGVARVWSRNGALVHTLRGHKGPIFSLKWNKRGNYLLSGSYDQTTIVWDVSGATGFVEQQFDDHQAPALDVDWKDDVTFASCSTDKTVHICRVGVAKPLKTYTGHVDEVNAVKWDPSGTLLASCSDDCTAKVWDVGSDRTDPMQDFKSHLQEIYTVKW
jgi:transducin (beta)-like 1